MTNIVINGSAVPVYCDLDTPNGPWITVLRHNTGSNTFNRQFQQYQNGFGNPSENHFIGMLNIACGRKQKVLTE